MTQSVFTQPLTAWSRQVLEHLRALPGGGNAEDAEIAWQRFSASPSPVVTIFGAYDAGKSSLLKRLLVDGGQEVPAWLTVSGRRETYEVQEVEVAGLVLRDTPGISGGNSEHEAIAREALALSDAYLVALPPQLLTSEHEAVMELLSGRYFHPSGLPLGPAMTVAVSRMDEAGIDPSENEAGYRALAARKREELAALFRRANVAFSESALHTVAADPYQQVGNMRQPPRDMYDEFRGWDGIEALSAGLDALKGRLPELREQAQTRYFARLAHDCWLAIQQESTGKALVLEEAENQIERLKLQEGQLANLMRAARTELDGLVENELVSAASHGGTTRDDILKFVEPRLNKALEGWAAKHQSQFDQLARDIEQELKDRAARQGGRRLRDYFSEEPTDEKGDGGAKETLKKAKAAGATLRHGLKDLHEAVTGRSIKQSREELKKLEGFGSFQEYQSKVKGKGRFQSAAQAEKARDALKVHDALSIGVPVLLELGTLGMEIYADHKRGAERAEKRERLMGQLKEAAGKLAEDHWKPWKEEGEGLEAWLEDQRKVYEASRAPLKAELELLAKAQQDFERLLDQAPGRPS